MSQADKSRLGGVVDPKYFAHLSWADGQRLEISMNCSV